jgi:hypothetical protein
MLGPNPSGGGYTLIGGLQYASDYLFTSVGTYLFQGTTFTWDLTGALANQFLISEGGYSFSDPTNYIINNMRDIAFRIALQAAKDDATASNATQTVNYTGKRARTVYATDFRFVAAATALNILTIIAISMTYWGWWALGRAVSLSPLEIAKAFDASLLQDTDSNATAHQLLEHLKRKDFTVRYGEVGFETKTGLTEGREDVARLVVADSREVKQPVVNSTYG